MNTLLIGFIFLLLGIGIFFSYLFKNSIRRRNKNKKSQRRIDSWMQMSREERQMHDLKQKKMSAERKRSLLNDIRNEYKGLINMKNK